MTTVGNKELSDRVKFEEATRLIPFPLCHPPVKSLRPLSMPHFTLHGLASPEFHDSSIHDRD
ncbi:hypothetical protein ACHHYP_13553 [Achlya hypogyna]|uniref:Uncharacterized protein n=1 Tax=Achlya hypogyna TaxID=1202772 RepID=A0A1V9YEY1_ACHHY|nr:hypothetical protein ACHHYP_13553 [Achlya hypogyna]